MTSYHQSLTKYELTGEYTDYVQEAEMERRNGTVGNLLHCENAAAAIAEELKFRGCTDAEIESIRRNAIAAFNPARFDD